MIKEINMPMMAPVDPGSSDESAVAWEDIPAAGPADIQSGRNVYIELNEEKTATKASAGKILQFIKEGYMPVLKEVHSATVSGALVSTCDWICGATLDIQESDGVVTMYALSLPSGVSELTLFAYPDALEKPFTTVQRESSGGGEQQAQ